MANQYNTNPIYLDTDFTTGWRTIQTFASSQPGIRVEKVMINLASTAVTSVLTNITVKDPSTSQVLLPITVPAGLTAPIVIDWQVDCAHWRDFNVTGLTASKTTMAIWYRN